MAASRVKLFLAPAINTKHEIGQVASTFIKVFRVTRRGIEPSLLWWRVLTLLHD